MYVIGQAYRYRAISATFFRNLSVRIGSGDTPPSFGREKKGFRNYLLRSPQPVCFRYEGVPYKITIQDVKLFPQGYSAIALHPELIQDEPSVLLDGRCQASLAAGPFASATSS